MKDITVMRSELDSSFEDKSINFVGLPDRDKIIISDLFEDFETFGERFTDPEEMKDKTNIHLVLSPHNSSEYHIHGRIVQKPVNEVIKTDTVTKAVEKVLDDNRITF